MCSAERRDFCDDDDDELISLTSVLAESGKLSNISCRSSVSTDAVEQELGPWILTVEQELGP